METIKLNNGTVTAYQTREEITQFLLAREKHRLHYFETHLDPQNREGKYIKELIELCPKNTEVPSFAFLWHFTLENRDTWGATNASTLPFSFISRRVQNLFLEYYDTRRNLPEIEDLRQNIKKGTTLYHSTNGEIKERRVQVAELELAHSLYMRVNVEGRIETLHFNHTPNELEAYEADAMFTNKQLAITHAKRYLKKKLEEKRKQEHRIITKMQKLNQLETN